MTRELLLVGSVPLRPADAVFELIGPSLGPYLPRIPDGDQHGWILAAVSALADNDVLVPIGHVEISRGGARVPRYGLRVGRSPKELRLGPYGYAETAARSYRRFLELRDRGTIPAGTRFQVTMPGPGTSAHMVEAPSEHLFRAAREALAAELRQLLDVVPAHDLAFQIDLAMEAEHEEYRRRPDAFETPIHDTFDWTLDEMAQSAAWLADQLPADAQLGFHICSIWHHYQPGGQDNAVLVDTANAVSDRVQRRIDYVHIPTIPEHDVEDFTPLRDLRLAPDTTVYLGVIHRSDGLEGAKRRIAAAETALPRFGVASFCGLGIRSEGSAVRVGRALHEDLRDDSHLTEIIALHRDVAALAPGTAGERT